MGNKRVNWKGRFSGKGEGSRKGDGSGIGEGNRKGEDSGKGERSGKGKWLWHHLLFLLPLLQRCFICLILFTTILRILESAFTMLICSIILWELGRRGPEHLPPF